MTYFRDFQTIRYDLTTKADADSQVVGLTDLTTRISLRLDEQTMDELTEKYIIRDMETPEIVSQKLYKTPFYHWTILYINQITDYHSGWPMNDEALHAYALTKYSDIYATHHYEKMPEMVEMDAQFIYDHYGVDAAVEITNIAYEEQLNDFKRYIRVIKPKYITTFSDKFKSGLING